MRLEMFTAEQVEIFIALEVGEANDHFVGIEGRSDLGDAIRKFPDEEFLFVGITFGELFDRAA